MIRGGVRRLRRSVAATLSLVPSLASAQVMASERGSVSQTVDGTTITIEYSRPVARGRTPFPDVVRYGRPWTPGANWATTLEVDKDVHINGNPLPKGKYSVWVIPGADEWTVTFNREARRFHTQKPNERDEQLASSPWAGTGNSGWPSTATGSRSAWKPKARSASADPAAARPVSISSRSTA